MCELTCIFKTAARVWTSEVTLDPRPSSPEHWAPPQTLMLLCLCCFVYQLTQVAQRPLQQRHISVLAASIIHSSFSYVPCCIPWGVLPVDASFLLVPRLSARVRYSTRKSTALDRLRARTSWTLSSKRFPSKLQKVPFCATACSKKCQCLSKAGLCRRLLQHPHLFI